MSQINTLVEAIRFFSDKQNCINAVALMRWEDGSPVCPKCGAEQGERNHYWLKAQSRWKCYACRKQFSVKVGTIFEDSPLDLHIWLTALWMLCNCKNGVSRSLSEISHSPTDFCVVARGEEHCATVCGAWWRLVPTGLELDFS